MPYGQELEPETHAVCLTGMLLRTLESDPGGTCPRTSSWAAPCPTTSSPASASTTGCPIHPSARSGRRTRLPSMREHTEKGFDGRFGPGLPRINDGSMLFLLHLANKLELPERAVAVQPSFCPARRCSTEAPAQASPRFVAGCWKTIWLKAIVALPTEIFFRTGIGTYLWVLSNKKPKHVGAKVQLINATGLWTSIKNEGNKRRIISDDQSRQIVEVYAAAENGERQPHARLPHLRLPPHPRAAAVAHVAARQRGDGCASSSTRRRGASSRRRSQAAWERVSSRTWIDAPVRLGRRVRGPPRPRRSGDRQGQQAVRQGAGQRVRRPRPGRRAGC